MVIDWDWQAKLVAEDSARGLTDCAPIRVRSLRIQLYG